jgi:hypothetical protein
MRVWAVRQRWTQRAGMLGNGRIFRGDVELADRMRARCPVEQFPLLRRNATVRLAFDDRVSQEDAEPEHGELPIALEPWPASATNHCAAFSGMYSRRAPPARDQPVPRRLSRLRLGGV